MQLQHIQQLKTRRLNTQSLKRQLQYLGQMRFVFTLVLTLLLSACNQASNENSTAKAGSTPATMSTKLNQHQASKLTRSIWLKGETLLANASKKSHQFNSSIETLLNNPTPETMQVASKDWHETMAAIEHCFTYLQLARARPTDFDILHRYLSYIATWPIQPGYLDTFGRYQYSGIVFDVELPINESSLRSQHGLTDLNEVSLGLYAIEFIMLGETHQRSPLALTPITTISADDKENGYSNIKELPRNRRRQLLQAQAAILAKDTQGLTKIWRANDSDSLQRKMTQFTAQQQIQTFIQTTVYVVLEQIKVLSQLHQQTEQHHAEEHQDSNHLHLTSLQQAKRLKHQTLGMKEFIELINEEYSMSKDIALIDTVIMSIEKVITQISSQQNDATDLQINWKETYSHLKNLAENILHTHSPNNEAAKPLIPVKQASVTAPLQ